MAATSPSAESFAALWADPVHHHGDRPFPVFKPVSAEPSTWSYAESDDQVTRVQYVLRATGLSAGDCVHIVLKNSPAFVAICSQERAGTYHQEAGGVCPWVIEVAEHATDLVMDSALTSRPPGDRVLCAVSSSDRLAVMLTSGTASELKGVVWIQACYAHAVASMAAARFRAHHRWCVSLPLSYANVQYCSFVPAIAAAVRCLASAETRYVTGTCLHADGGTVFEQQHLFN